MGSRLLGVVHIISRMALSRQSRQRRSGDKDGGAHSANPSGRTKLFCPLVDRSSGPTSSSHVRDRVHQSATFRPFVLFKCRRRPLGAPRLRRRCLSFSHTSLPIRRRSSLSLLFSDPTERPPLSRILSAYNPLSPTRLAQPQLV